MKVLITKAVARELVARMDEAGTPEAAAHQIEVELRAIEPYTNRELVVLQGHLQRVAMRLPDKAALAIRQIRAIAEGDE